MPSLMKHVRKKLQSGADQASNPDTAEWDVASQLVSESLGQGTHPIFEYFIHSAFIIRVFKKTLIIQNKPYKNTIINMKGYIRAYL